MATRAVRGYRTISRDAACLLAGSLPWDLDAQALADVFWRRAAVRAEGGNPLPDVARRWRSLAEARAIGQWAERLEEPSASVALITAIRPVFREWIGRGHGALTFHLTQILTGHGCFGRYLCEIVRREDTAGCHHCVEDRDTAEHTVSACPAWITQRAVLTTAIGEDTSLPALIRAMLESEEKWTAVETFAHDVVSTKEEAERRRERGALGLRSRRQGRRRVGRNGHDVPS